MLYIFELVEDGQMCGVNQFYSVMEWLKMFDILQVMQFQFVIVKVMYVVMIESEFDFEKVFEYIMVVDNKDMFFVNMFVNYVCYYSINSIKLGGVKIFYLYLGDELNLQIVQDFDNGFLVLEQVLLWYIVVGLGVFYEQFLCDYFQVSYFSVCVFVNEFWCYFLGWCWFIVGWLVI